MNSAVIQLIVLAGIAVFLILRLRNVLGTRNGFEDNAPDPVVPTGPSPSKPDLSVVEGGIDRDIADYVDLHSSTGQALAAMKRAEPGFSVHEFLSGARSAYEMILGAFEASDKETLRQFLSNDVYATFSGVIDTRLADGLRVDSTFIGIRELKLQEATFDPASQRAEITIRFVGEMTSVVRNEAGEIIEGKPEEIKRQKDIWTFARDMGSDDPNWQLVATGG